jgi:hypothetical protein
VTVSDTHPHSISCRAQASAGSDSREWTELGERGLGEIERARIRLHNIRAVAHPPSLLLRRGLAGLVCVADGRQKKGMTEKG